MNTTNWIRSLASPLVQNGPSAWAKLFSYPEIQVSEAYRKAGPRFVGRSMMVCGITTRIDDGSTTLAFQAATRAQAWRIVLDMLIYLPKV